MEISIEDINPKLKNARENGEELGELLALFAYFMKHTPEGRAVGQELERDWQETCTKLREEKRLVGADFTLYEWLKQIQKELLSEKRPAKAAKKAKAKPARAPKKKVLRFRGID